MTNEAPSVFIYRVETPDGMQDLVALVPSEVAFKDGLTSQCVVGKLSQLPQPGGRIAPEHFVPNPVFVAFLHDFLGRDCPMDPACQAEAERLGKGWLYIIDHRAATPAGEVPPEDIVGALEIDQGRVVPGSYRPSPQHRLLTSRGFFRLSPAVHARLVTEAARRQGA